MLGVYFATEKRGLSSFLWRLSQVCTCFSGFQAVIRSHVLLIPLTITETKQYRCFNISLANNSVYQPCYLQLFDVMTYPNH